MNKPALSVTTLLILSTSVSHADSLEPTPLDPMIITATRTAQTVDKSLASVTVITRADIERRQALSLPEVLRGVPGLSMSNNGGLGKNTSVFMRGTQSDHVLVLVDGIRMGSVTLGTTAFQDIPVDQIERIEIVRGPRSSLYGSEAIGGVIHIFTRKGEGQDLRPSFSISGGTHDTFKVSGGLSGGYGSSWFNLNVSHQETDGFNTCRGNETAGCFTIEPDKDGYRNTSGSVRAGHRFDHGLEIEASFLHAEGDNQFDGTQFGGNSSDVVQQAVSGSLKYSPITNWDVTLRAGRSADESELFFAGDQVDRFDSERISVNLQNDIRLSTDQLLTAGMDFYEDEVDNTKGFAVNSRYNIAGFAQYQAGFGNHDVILGVRYDANEQFGDHFTGNVGWGYSFNNGLRLSANLGSAFKAPTFNELYFPNFGNADLDSEQSWTAELGLAGDHLDIDWSINGFYTDVDELIAFDSETFKPVNTDRARMAGFEVAAATQFMGVDVDANFSYVDHEDRGSGPNKGNELARRPKEMFQLNVDRNFGRFSLGTTVFASGSRYDDLANKHRLSSYVTVDLRGGVKLYEHVFLQGRINNLLDKTYETARLFNQDGTNFLLSLSYRP